MPTAASPPPIARVFFYCLGQGMLNGFIGALVAAALSPIIFLSNGVSAAETFGSSLSTALAFAGWVAMWGALFGTAAGFILGALQGLLFAFANRSLCRLIDQPRRLLVRCRAIALTLTTAAAITLTLYILLESDPKILLWYAPVIAITLAATWLAANKYARWFTQASKPLPKQIDPTGQPINWTPPAAAANRPEPEEET